MVTKSTENFVVGNVTISKDGVSINYGSPESPNSRGVSFSKDEFLTTRDIASWPGQSLALYTDRGAVIDIQIGATCILDGLLRRQRLGAMRPVDSAYVTADTPYSTRAPA